MFWNKSYFHLSRKCCFRPRPQEFDRDWEASHVHCKLRYHWQIKDETVNLDIIAKIRFWMIWSVDQWWEYLKWASTKRPFHAPSISLRRWTIFVFYTFGQMFQHEECWVVNHITFLNPFHAITVYSTEKNCFALFAKLCT